MDSANLPHSPTLQRRTSGAISAAIPQVSLDNISDNNSQTLSRYVLTTLRSWGLTLPTIAPTPNLSPTVPPAPVPTVVTTPIASRSDIYDNARFEQIACTGLSQKYNGSPDQLIPTLNLIHLRRQNEVWFGATFLTIDDKMIDLIKDFSRLTLEAAKQQANYGMWRTPTSCGIPGERPCTTHNCLPYSSLTP